LPSESYSTSSKFRAFRISIKVSEIETTRGPRTTPGAPNRITLPTKAMKDEIACIKDYSPGHESF
jgi:hypothetical protein